MERKHGPTRPPEGRLSERSRHRPFNVHWLDSALHETLLPGSPWEQVHDRISDKLVKSLESDLAGSEEQRQMILQLLGPQFINRYMENTLHRPDIFDPSVFDAEEKKQLQHSTQLLLKDKLDHVIKDLGYTPPSSNASTPVPDRQPPSDHHKDQGASDMQAVFNHARGIFKTGLERDLVLYEMEQKQEQSDLHKSKAEVKLTSSISDHLGKSLIAILQRDPSRLDTICQRLTGRQLPETLRSYMWVKILLRMVDGVGGGKEKPSEKLIRKRFAKAVSKGKVDMKITNATECPIGGLIETAVREKFDTTPCMQAHRLDKVHKQARQALNILYTYNRSYEPFLIDWIFPLQLAFQEHQKKEEHPYELALYLDLLQTYAFPKWPEIFAVAEQAMARLQMDDEELYSHLQRCAVSNVKVDPQEFLVHLIDAEKRKAAALSWSTSVSNPSGNAADTISKKLLANPLIFLRKWVGEGFVCVLKTHVVMYIWDQCFIERWDRQVLEDACMALLFLLKDQFMEAHDHYQMRQVFLSEPSEILTLEFVKAYQRIRSDHRSDKQRSITPSPVATPVPAHVTPQPAEATPEPVQATPEQAQATPEPVQATPEQAQATPEPVQATPEQAQATPEPVQASSEPAQATPEPAEDAPVTPPPEPQPERIKLSRAGLKNIRLKLMWNLTIQQLADFQTEKLRITLFLSVNDKTLQEKQIKDAVVISSFAKDKGDQSEAKSPEQTGQETNEVIKHQVPVPIPEIIFSVEELDLLKYDRELKPQVVLQIQYGPKSDESDGDQHENKTSIGWALIPVYTKETAPSSPVESKDGTTHQISTWLASAGDQTVPLYFGEVPEDVTADGAMKQFAKEDLLQEGTEVSVTLFDPKDTDIPPEEGFDLYIDGIRFLPDVTTICKVTGHIALPLDENHTDMIATAILDSSARCPRFKYRYTIPTAKPTNVVVMKIYTIDKLTRSVVILGATILQLYVGESPKKLNTGGFQLRMHAGMLSLEDKLMESTLAKLPIIPACSFLVRLLPRSEGYVPAPDYASGYYNSDSFQPTASEQRVIGHYQRSASWDETVRINLQRLRLMEQSTEELTDEELAAWEVNRLNTKKKSDKDPDIPLKRFDLVRCVDYDEEEGLYVSVQSARAVKADNMYTNVSARILPGSDVTSKGELRPSDTEQFLVQDVKPSSPQSAPVYTNRPKKLHPSYSTKSYLLLQVIGLSITYKPDPANKGPGTMFGKDGKKPVSLESDSRLGWCLLPMFEDGCVAQGVYQLPIFQDNGKFPFLRELSEAPDLYGWMVSAIKKGTITLNSNYASLVLSLWDGHFDKTETVPLSTEYKFFNVGDFPKFSKAAEGVKGQPISDLILQSMPPKVRAEGVLSEVYWQEEAWFQEAMRKAFKDVIDKLELIEV